jgi:predicted MFS family arabinose efflux permease
VNRPISERKLVFLVGAGQFITTLDFTMVLPLGPDFAKALDIPVSKLGMLGGSYTIAQAAAGIAGALFLDRFDRRRMLAIALTGLAVATAGCGLATGFVSLLTVRMVAGVFGGIAETLAYTILSDAIAPERRGRALGAIMSAFAVASVLGLPAGLELARVAGWRAPFFTLAALGAVVTVAATSLLPPQRAHLHVPSVPFRDVLRRSVVWLGLCGTAIGYVAHYALVPNLSAYFQFNRGYPRDQLGLLYMIGGVTVFANTRLAGWLSDRYGTSPVVLFGAALYTAALVLGFLYPVDAIPVLAVFVGLTIAAGFRFVPMRALLLRIPAPQERARFLSLQSAVFSIGSGIGATLGAQILSERPDRSLTGIDNLACLAIALTLVYAALGYVIEHWVRMRSAAGASTATTDLATTT